MITDKNLPDSYGDEAGGMYLLRYVKQNHRSTEVIMITGYATIESAIEAMKIGAFDYIMKPFAIERLKEKVDRIIEFKRFLNPEHTIQSFKEFRNEVLSLIENPSRLLDEEVHNMMKSIYSRVDHYFSLLFF